MAAGYMVSYAQTGAANVQVTGSTQIFLTNASASFVNPDPSGDIFWTTPDVGDNWVDEPNLVIAYAGGEVANPVPNPPYGEGETAFVTFWATPYDPVQTGYLELLNTVAVQLGQPEGNTIEDTLELLKLAGAWTNYNTDIPAFPLTN